MMAAAGAVTRRSMPLFDGGVYLGDVDVLLPPGTESASSSCMDLGQPAVFPRNEIRISRRSPASEKCPPLAVLHVISAYSLRCKFEAKAADLHPTSLLHRLHDSCWKKGMVANGHSVLHTLTNIACHARKGFFSDFDGMLLKNINELMYENEVLDLPYNPDVGDYLQFKNNNTARHNIAPMVRS
ncbi:hypothetical protein VPH35_120873 [Triticum aestivum]